MTAPAILICLRIADAKPEHVVTGSQRRTCRACGFDVWASPAGLRIGDVVAIECVPCAVMNGPPDDVAPMTTGQVREVLDHLKNNA